MTKKVRTLEELTNEKEQIREQLDALKTSTQKEKTEEEKKEIENINKKINGLKKEISEKLQSSDTSAEDRKKLEKLDAELTPFTTELSSLKWVVLSSTTEQTTTTQEITSEETEEKWIFGKTWDWTKEQWWDVWDSEKWKEEPGLNTLRTAWFVATGVGAVSLIYKGLKKLFWNDKKERKEDKKEKEEKKMSRWKKWLLWVGGIFWAWLAGFGIYKNWNSISSWFKEKLGKALTIEESVSQATAEVRAWKYEESPYLYHFDGIEYDKNRNVVKSYGFETKINPWKKTIEWLNDVSFPDYMQLIHAANIVNCMKLNFHYRCASDKPFTRTDGGGGDMQVCLANNEKPECLSASDSNTRTYVLWGTGATVGTLLWWYCAGAPGAIWLWATLWIWWAAAWQAIDNDSTLWNNSSTVSSWIGFQKFITYLNEQKDSKGDSLREFKEDRVDTPSPVQDDTQGILDEIHGTYSENGNDIDRRDFEVIPDPNDKELFLVKSFNEDAPLKIEWAELNSDWKLDYTKIKSIKILKYKKHDRWEGLEMDFPHSKEGLLEAIKTANLTNKIRCNYHNMWGEDLPFGCGIYWNKHLQIDTNETRVRGRNILYSETISSKFPTLWKDLNRQVNKSDKEKLWQQAHWNQDLEGYWSRYIRFLHQMRENSSSSLWKTKS